MIEGVTRKFLLNTTKYDYNCPTKSDLVVRPFNTRRYVKETTIRYGLVVPQTGWHRPTSKASSFDNEVMVKSPVEGYVDIVEGKVKSEHFLTSTKVFLI